MYTTWYSIAVAIHHEGWFRKTQHPAPSTLMKLHNFTLVRQLFVYWYKTNYKLVWAGLYQLLARCLLLFSSSSLKSLVHVLCSFPRLLRVRTYEYHSWYKERTRAVFCVLAFPACETLGISSQPQERKKGQGNLNLVRYNSVCLLSVYEQKNASSPIGVRAMASWPYQGRCLHYFHCYCSIVQHLS